MTVEDVLQEISEEIDKRVPEGTEITDIEFEGAVLVIYTKQPENFARDGNLVKNLAKSLRKRVSVRPDPSVLADPEEGEDGIRDIVPDDADITDLFFDTDTGEVVIEAKKPGLVIGKGGSTLNEIKKRIGWTPKVVRTPPMASKTVEDIREYLRNETEYRKKFLRKVGRRIFRGTTTEQTWIRTTSLGGYQEVGRNCHLLSTRDSKIMIDCGVAVGANEGSETPHLNVPEVFPLDSLDAVVLTHAHLDHCGLIPLLFKYGYTGPVYCTPPTRDLMVLLQMDYLKVAANEGRTPPYSADEIRKQVLHTVPLRWGETTDIAPDLRLTFQNAGHIIGSSSAHFHIGDGDYNICYSGDTKFENTWLFNAADNKFPRLETLVMEATYGGHNDHQPSRKAATEQLKNIIRRTLGREGKVIVPVFAVGRSQEVMLVLEDMMRSGAVEQVPIYLDGMIYEATAIHTAYPEFLNNKLRNQIFHEGKNPLLSDIFERVDSHESRQRIIEDPEPCIVLATAGMMNGGPVLEYFKNWCEDPDNSLIFVGYQASGTLGSKLQKGRSEITVAEGGRSHPLKVNLNIETCDGFSGHSDRNQLIQYVSQMKPRPNRILIHHGDERSCREIASVLYQKYKIKTEVPANLETLRLK